MPKNVVGDSRYFVTGKGFVQVRTFDAILAQDGTKRLFAELTADHDAPRTRVDVALKWLLDSLRPGWVMRFGMLKFVSTIQKFTFILSVFGKSSLRPTRSAL